MKAAIHLILILALVACAKAPTMDSPIKADSAKSFLHWRAAAERNLPIEWAQELPRALDRLKANRAHAEKISDPSGVETIFLRYIDGRTVRSVLIESLTQKLKTDYELQLGNEGSLSADYAISVAESRIKLERLDPQINLEPIFEAAREKDAMIRRQLESFSNR
ncbi:MAG: hypothetical protein KBC32_11650 [Candidatus Didemnitutus sp.]|nr:hypothetical protein [Candidatus Didemnitutus sp.]